MSDTYSGPLSVHDDSADINSLAFLISQKLGELWTVAVVKVMAVTSSGGLAPAGTVDVMPLVSMVDGQQQTTPHGTIHGLIYFRLQGGANAVIIDPVIGDKGITVHATRDISTVKATKAASPPGSSRRFDAADGIYLGGVLNGTPTQYVQFNASGITVVSPTAIVLQAPTITAIGSFVVDGSITATGYVTGDGIVLDTHVHSGVTTGSGNSGPPV